MQVQHERGEYLSQADETDHVESQGSSPEAQSERGNSASMPAQSQTEYAKERLTPSLRSLYSVNLPKSIQEDCGKAECVPKTGATWGSPAKPTSIIPCRPERARCRLREFTPESDMKR
ncbi:hypothetical protein AOLI_G00032480 [Acnodon oligacanthus]